MVDGTINLKFDEHPVDEIIGRRIAHKGVKR